jgi:hypothetical protein
VQLLEKESSERLIMTTFFTDELPVELRLKRDGTSLREEAGVKGKLANGVGTQLMKSERQVTAGSSVTTNNETMCTLRLLAAD